VTFFLEQLGDVYLGAVGFSRAAGWRVFLGQLGDVFLERLGDVFLGAAG
jgi:hypothetical protein